MYNDPFSLTSNYLNENKLPLFITPHLTPINFITPHLTPINPIEWRHINWKISLLEDVLKKGLVLNSSKTTNSVNNTRNVPFSSMVKRMRWWLTKWKQQLKTRNLFIFLQTLPPSGSNKTNFDGGMEAISYLNILNQTHNFQKVLIIWTYKQQPMPI